MLKLMKRIALFMENSRAYGREMIRGIADFYQPHHDIVLEMIGVDDLKSTNKLKDFDGAIARIITRDAGKVLKDAGIPVVDALCQFSDTGFMRADANHEAIGEQAAEFFLSRGFKNFAFFGFQDAAFSDARCAGYVQRLVKAGATCQIFRSETVSYSTIFAESTQSPRRPEALIRWLQALPDRTALFCANDIRAYQALRAAENADISVPENIAVLGVDNDPLICAFARPQLSSIDPNAHDVGYAAATILHAAVKRGNHRVRPVTGKPKGIVERASTKLLHSGPPWLKDAVDFIVAHTDKALTTAHIVRLTGLSHTAVERAFRKYLGESTGKYILRSKMNEAKRLLDLGNISSKEVAFRIGFASPQYFCRAFKAFFGHSPFDKKPRPS